MLFLFARKSSKVRSFHLIKMCESHCKFICKPTTAYSPQEHQRTRLNWLLRVIYKEDHID